MKPEITNLSLLDHLAELRTRIIYSAWIILVGTGVSWAFSEQIFEIIRQPIAPYLGPWGLVFTAPMDKFLAHLKISILAGAVVSSPFWLYQVWKFISPALHSNEKRMATFFVAFGTVLFLLGVFFVYFFVYPMAFKYLLNFAGTADKPMITINEYVSFFLTTTAVFGLAFELPLILMILAMLGVVNQKFLRSRRRYAIVILSIIAAFITPPDVLSMLLLLVPLILLYEISIFLVGWVSKKRQKQV